MAQSSKGGFEEKYVDSFYVLIAMKNEVSKVFPKNSDVVITAKQGLYGRYCHIISMMDDSGVSNPTLRKEMYEKTMQEVGNMLDFKIRRKILKLKKQFRGINW